MIWKDTVGIFLVIVLAIAGLVAFAQAFDEPPEPPPVSEAIAV